MSRNTNSKPCLDKTKAEEEMDQEDLARKCDEQKPFQDLKWCIAAVLLALLAYGGVAAICKLFALS